MEEVEVTNDLIKECFVEYNKKYFNNILPMPKFIVRNWENSFNHLGMAKSPSTISILRFIPDGFFRNIYTTIKYYNYERKQRLQD